MKTPLSNSYVAEGGIELDGEPKVSVGRDEHGRPFIRDIVTANAECEAHSRPYVDSRKW